MIALENRYFTVEVDADRSLVRVKRSAARFEQLDDVERAFSDVAGSVGGLDRTRHAFLLDLREGPLRNDEAFENAVRKYAGQTTEGWRKSAMLVRSAVGELQLSRQGRESGLAFNVFRDEAEALRFLEA